MKKKILSAISAFLLIVLLAGVVACDGGGQNEVTEEADTTVEETERIWIDNLEDEDYKGAEIRILTVDCDNFDKNFFEEGAEKEVVSASMLRKVQNVENRFNIVMICPEFTDAAGGIEYVPTNLRRSVDSQLNEFDIVSGNGLTTAPLAMSGYVVNMAGTDDFEEIISLDQPWWCSEYTDALNVEEYMYWLNGYQWSGTIHQMYSVFFNIEMSKLVLGEDYSLYDDVREGKWTISELMEYAKLAYKDDGNGEVDENDRFGFGIEDHEFIDKVAMCANATYTKRDEYNIPVVNFNTEQNVRINEILYDIVHDKSFVYTNAHGAFTDGNMLFYSHDVAAAVGHRNLEWDFGILPMPKYDENQEFYMNTCHYADPVIGIPTITKEDLYPLCYTVMEACAAETYRIVRPAWLDSALKNKYSRDEDTKEMIDLLQGHVTTDFLIVYGGTSGYDKLFNSCYDTRDISSMFARKEKATGKMIQGMITKFEDCAK